MGSAIQRILSNISDLVYGAGWHESLDAPSKNAVYDKIETLMNLTGSNLAIGSDADGDTYYRASSVLARLAKGTSRQALTMNVGATAPEWADRLTLGTSVDVSGTSVDFTSIPAWVKRITISFVSVSTNGGSTTIVQLGDSGGFEDSNYLGGVQYFPADNTLGIVALSSGFRMVSNIAAAGLYSGVATLTLVTGNTWSYFSNVCRESSGTGTISAGVKTLSAALNSVRITTALGSDTFDSGSINILYE